MSRNMPVSPAEHPHAITWSEHNRLGCPYTARELLGQLRQKAGPIARHQRGPDFPERRPASVEGDNEATLTAELAWLKRRDKWLREAIGDAVMTGLRLPGLPWGPSPQAWTAGVLRWAEAALLHVEALANALVTEREEAHRREQQLAATVAEHQGGVARAAQTIRQLESELATERAQTQALRLQNRELEQQVRDLRRDLEAAQAVAQAWQTSAESSRHALAVLEVAAQVRVEDIKAERDLALRRTR